MAQLVEQRIRNAWVAGSSPAIGSPQQHIGSARASQAWEAGSIPVFRSKRRVESTEPPTLFLSQSETIANLNLIVGR